MTLKPQAPAPSPRPPLDVNRCAVCGWTLACSVATGCVRGNCSVLRPFPEIFFDFDRACTEYGKQFDEKHRYREPAPSVNSLREVRPDDGSPNCHVCGSIMVPDVKGHKCVSCGEATEPTGPAPSVVESRPLRHKIGSARTIQTAVLVCEYLRRALGYPHSDVHGDQIRYHFYDPTGKNGFWTADIIVEGNLSLEASGRFVNICRAFVAGRGEIWT